jgi:hypothetical protein
VSDRPGTIDAVSKPNQQARDRPPLPDRWHSRDFPVLLEVARALDSGASPDERRLTADLGISSDQLDASWHALREGEYLRVLRDRPRRLGDGAMTHIVLTERGRRAVGLWPSEGAGDELADLLRQAADRIDDPEEQTLLRRAAGAVGSVSRGVMTDVIAALVKSQAGL